MMQNQTDTWIEEKLNLMKSELKTDEVVDSWFLMGSPWPLLAVLSSYLLFVLKVGPKMMEDRKPLPMKGVLLVYNFFQVLHNAWIMWLLFSHPGALRYIGDRICSLIGRKNNPFFLPLLAGSWHFFMSKVFDLLDTIFFVLRKKQSQVTVLHVVHHSNMVVVAWIYLKFMKAEHGVLIGVLNAFVHVIMYTYYFLSAVGPSVQKYLWWKAYVTRLQITHFVMIIAFVCLLKWNQCGIPLTFTLYSAANAFVYLILFLNFYSKTYNAYRKIEDKVNLGKNM